MSIMDKYGDVIGVGAKSGSASTYYGDTYWVSISAYRVLARGCSNANAYGGVSCSYANSGASYSGALYGSRLAFRGKLVKASSVARYKAAREVA